MGFGSVLVELHRALQIGDLHLERHNAVQHRPGVGLGQVAPLLRIRRLMLGNQAFEQTVAVFVRIDDARAHLGLHRQISPGRHALLFRINTGRHVGLWPHETHQSLRLRGQQLRLRVGAGAMPQQNAVFRLQAIGPQRSRLPVHRDVAEHRETVDPHRHDGRQGVFAHDALRDGGIGVVELLGEVHGALRLPNCQAQTLHSGLDRLQPHQGPVGAVAQ